MFTLFTVDESSIGIDGSTLIHCSLWMNISDETFLDENVFTFFIVDESAKVPSEQCKLALTRAGAGGT